MLTAPADGHSLLLATSAHAVGATLFPDPGYSLTKDFRAVGLAASVPVVLVSNLEVPPNMLRDLAAYTKAGNRLNFGSGGSGTVGHLLGEQFSSLVNGNMKHIPYKGGGPLMPDLLGNQIQLSFGNMPEVVSLIKGRRLKAFAVTGARRSSMLPDVPTFAEAGFGEIDARSWFGFFVPASTPPTIAQRLTDSIATVLADPATIAEMREIGADPGELHGQAFQTFVNGEVVRWGKLIKLYRAQPD